jgi:ethanolamine utilization cobalamin adenosyltransferase
MNIGKHKAIQALTPNAKYILRDNDLEWLDEDITRPTDEEINNKIAELQTAYDNNEYQRKREEAYPSVADFMEAYTEKEIGGNSTKWDAYKTAYNKVRTDNPKG